MNTCGDAGGVTQAGAPCGRPAGWGTDRDEGMCSAHGANLQAQKKAVLEAYGSGQGSLKAACAAVGVDQSTVWRWRQADPEFDEAFGRTKLVSYVTRLVEIEDAVFRQILAWEAPAAVVIFYMTNIARRLGNLTGTEPEWVNVNRMEHTGPGGDPISVREIVVNLPPDDEEETE